MARSKVLSQIVSFTFRHLIEIMVKNRLLSIFWRQGFMQKASFILKNNLLWRLLCIIYFVFILVSPSMAQVKEGVSEPEIYIFHSLTCPHCKQAFAWLPQLKEKFPILIIKDYEISQSKENRALFEEFAKKYHKDPQGVPTFFIGSEMIVGFGASTPDAVIKAVEQLYQNSTVQNNAPKTRAIDLPLIGTLDVERMSILKFTLIIGLLDGLNPCAMWVLMFLLGLLVYSKSKKKIFMVGGIFVLASGVVYFGFMAAWFNLFMIVGYSSVLTAILGSVAILMGLINIKELFFFKKGVSLMIPESAKPKLTKKVRAIFQEQNTAIAIFSTILLAVFVNFIELACTIGLPAIFTKVLSENHVELSTKYLYMALYNVAYVVPLAIIVGIFGLTLGHYKMTERHGKILKVVSGVLMLVLGLVMLLNPSLLSFS